LCGSVQSERLDHQGCEATRGVVRVSGTATCFGVGEGSRVVADPVGLWVVGWACSSAADTLRRRWGPSRHRLVLGERLIGLGSVGRLWWWKWRVARRAAARCKATAGLGAEPLDTAHSDPVGRLHPPTGSSSAIHHDPRRREPHRWPCTARPRARDLARRDLQDAHLRNGRRTSFEDCLAIMATAVVTRRSSSVVRNGSSSVVRKGRYWRAALLGWQL